MIVLSKLRHFTVLARCLSYARASEILNISQPALSRSIQSIELQYNVKLFDRGRSGVHLTQIGQQIFERAETLLYNASTFEEFVSKSSDGEAGTVRFGIGPFLLAHFSETIAHDVVAKFPGAHIRAGTGSVSFMLSQLVSGDLDFVIGHYHEERNHNRIQVDFLTASGPSFYVRPDHPLREAEDLWSLAPYPKVSGTAWNEALDWEPDPAIRKALRATVEIDDAAATTRICQETDGILIARLGARVSQGLRPLPIRLPYNLSTDIGIHTLADRSLSPIALAVIASFKREFTNMI